tara:strand:+ start:12342 stop:12833 length:492 start_codon:yes stop_codon:yes gene_type:complete
MKNDYSKTIKKFEKGFEKKTTRKLKDVVGFFKDKKEVEKILKTGNPILYEVFIKEFPPINLGLTVINSGTVGKEYYFTKGHIHKKKTPEFYILLDGKGELLLRKRSGKRKIIHLKKGEVALIEKGYAHRLVNIGRKKLKVLTIYHEDSKPDYSVIFKKRFFKR